MATKKKHNLVLTLIVAAGLAAISCSKSEEQVPGGPTGPTPTPPTDPGDTPVDQFSGQTFIPLIEYSTDIDGAHPQYVARSTALQVFFGSRLPGQPSSIEANNTGLQWIHLGTSGQLRFRTATNFGFHQADFVSIPNTGILSDGPNNVDMVFSSAPSSWYPDYSGAYNTIRIRATKTGTTIDGEICVRTTAHSDWAIYDLTAAQYLASVPYGWSCPAGHTCYPDVASPMNMVGTIFTRVATYAPWGQYKSNSVSEVTNLRNVFMSGGTFCPSVGTYGTHNPQNAVQRLMGHFTTNLSDIQ